MSPAIDDDEVRQAAMHNAAERAKIRRQQEEEEREKVKERARKKAEELAAKLGVQKVEAEAAQVNGECFFSLVATNDSPDTPNTHPGDRQTCMGKDPFQ